VRVERVFVAHDCGLIVNPDGLRNQIEGNVIQALSRALLEEVQFDRGGVRSVDWRGYPIMRFSDVPDEIGISLINRPEQPALGGGEPAGSPVFAALANAIFDATGARLRSVPFTPERVRAMLA
jgi:nicotinate dehydrogenase subunit B